MANLSDRLLILIEDISNGNVSEFANITKTKQATMHNYTKGRQPNAESLYNICKYAGVNINWLLTGEGEKYLADLVAQDKKDYVLNIDLLSSIIRAIERELDSRELELDADKKAEAISLLYELYSDSQKSIDETTIGRYLRLVA